MARRNYGRRSGIIVDMCKDDGLWFDAGELERILAWIRDGGLAEAKRRNAQEERAEDARWQAARQAPAGSRAVEWDSRPSTDFVSDLLGFVSWF
jgi:Zn-finger nucleic acid-binding protein